MASIFPRVTLGSLLCLALAAPVEAEDAPRSPEPVPQKPAADAAPAFPTPETAADALLAAFESNDDAALHSLLGAANVDLAQDGNDPAVRLQRREIAAVARVRRTIEDRPGGRRGIVVGSMEHPLAIPLRKDADGWRFDAEEGRAELLARRIGENELEAIGLCLRYVEAQGEYASVDRDGDGVLEYAQRLLSTPGAKDGLYWDAEPGEDESPAGPDLLPFVEARKAADAQAGREPTPTGEVVAGETPQSRPPFNGYYWRVLTAQGPSARGGARSYVVDGNLVGGFGLLAVPASHGDTGVKSFLVSRGGRVFERDLGPDGLEVAASIDAFDPDASWREVDRATIALAQDASLEDARPDAARPPTGTRVAGSTGGPCGSAR